MKITVVGAGYVGFSLAVLISQKYPVIVLDNDEGKISQINSGRSPIPDKEILKLVSSTDLNLVATHDQKIAYTDADYVIIATPTNYDSQKESFDTSSVESVIRDTVSINSDANIVIKSTIPIGFTDLMRKKYKHSKVLFSPEFLRENNALLDNLNPSRIVVGDTTKEAMEFANILSSCAEKKEDIPILYMQSKEAEAIKLFSNTYLAMRVSFFNELDSFAEIQNLSARKIIEGVSLDPRIGNFYNNPSFGYGGYCLPKDTKQLLTNFDKIPNNIIKAVVEANETRKDFIVETILKKNPSTVGVYGLSMKYGSDNHRESAVIDVLNKITQNKIKVILFEPNLKNLKIKNVQIAKDVNELINLSDLIIANRYSRDLDSAVNKVYSRDLFNEN